MRRTSYEPRLDWPIENRAPYPAGAVPLFIGLHVGCAMQMKLVLSAAPDWFDIKKYAAVANFDIFDWHWNINYRLGMTGDGDIDEKLKEAYLERSDEAKKAGDEYYLQRLTQLLDRPAMLVRPERKNTNDWATVRDMSVKDAMCLAEELHKSEKYARAWEAFDWSMTTSEKWILDQLEGKYDDLDDSANDLRHENYPSSANYVYAEVDIHAPLDDLIDSFREWVQGVKESRGIPFHSKRVFSDVDFKRWHKYAVLPYIDLKLWASFHDVHIPDWLYANTLFRDFQGDIDGMFRKNTKPLEQQVFTQACLDQLRNQADIRL